MTSHLPQRSLRMLVLGALLCAPLITVANSPVGTDRRESVVHSAKAWLSLADPAGWAGDGFAIRVAESEHPMSFAHAARAGTYGQQPADAAVFSRDGAVTHGDVWSANFLSHKQAPSAFASVATPVPEPGTYVLMLAGLAAVGFVMRRRKHS